MDHIQTYQPLLFSIAYRMTGYASQAEDIVQEAYLRYQQADGGGKVRASLSPISGQERIVRSLLFALRHRPGWSLPAPGGDCCGTRRGSDC